MSRGGDGMRTEGKIYRETGRENRGEGRRWGSLGRGGGGVREVNPAPLGRRRKVELQLTIQGPDMGEKNPLIITWVSPLWRRWEKNKSRGRWKWMVWRRLKSVG